MRIAAPLTPIRHVLAALALLICGLALVPSGADAAVAYRNKTCGTKTNSFGIPPYAITLAKPPTAVVGDLMIASTRYSAFYSAQSSPAGWTRLNGNGNDSTSWYKFVQAGDTDWDFTMPSGPGSAVGGIAAFSGVDPNDPFVGAGAQTTTGTAAAVPLPNVTGATFAGSMRFSAVISGAAVTSTFTGMTEICDVTNGGMGLGTAYEAMGATTTTSRTDTRSGTGANVAQTFVLNPLPVCTGGALALSAPGNVVFPATTLNGFDQTRPGSTTLSVTDLTGSGSGWSLSGTSTTFTNGAYTLPTDATTVTGVGAAAAAGNCNLPTNSAPAVQTLPAGTVAPAATKLFNAAVGSGMGPVDLNTALSLKVPGRTHVGTYNSTWTFTLSSGP